MRRGGDSSSGRSPGVRLCPVRTAPICDTSNNTNHTTVACTYLVPTSAMPLQSGTCNTIWSHKLNTHNFNMIYQYDMGFPLGVMKKKCVQEKWDIRSTVGSAGICKLPGGQVYRCRVFCGLRLRLVGEGGLGSRAGRACSRILLHRTGRRRGAPLLAGRRRPRNGSPPTPNRS